MNEHILPKTSFEMNTISKGSLKITEYSDSDTGEVLRVYIQNGILGFFADEQEMNDLLVLLNYYLNIESISQIQ